MNAAPLEPRQLLIVEDDPGDVVLTREALTDFEARINVHVVSDGEAAIEFLLREGVYAAVPRPDLVLLDLNLPRMSGHGVLTRIKEDPGLRSIPVVVLTTSNAAEDVEASYDHHANAFVTKPPDLDRYVDVVRHVGGFFLTIARPPSPN